MANSALYFRFLGFKVVVPDLLGHGDSGGDLSFGIRDADVLNELLNSQSGVNQPLLIVGNSMGAIAAVELANKRKDVSGLILQAPMTVFDSATVNYANSYSPFISSFLSDNTIRSGALHSLERAQVSLAQTDIRPAVSKSEIPVLILASSDDPVAPFSYFEALYGPLLSVVNIPGRSHPGMAVIGQQDDACIQQWLKTTNPSHFHKTQANNKGNRNAVRFAQHSTP